MFTLDNDEFAKGDKVVYPAHGLGVVQAIQSRLVGGAQQKFYLIQIIDLDDAFTQGATMARSNPTLKQLERAAAALGKRLAISLD